jgi:hypothetical protein
MRDEQLARLKAVASRSGPTPKIVRGRALVAQFPVRAFTTESGNRKSVDAALERLAAQASSRRGAAK